MVITIYEGYDKSEVILGSRDEEFRKIWVRSHGAKIRTDNLYRELCAVASWVNNDLGEECLFEID